MTYVNSALKQSIKQKSLRGQNWTDDEVKVLICAWKIRLPEFLAHKKNARVYENISSDLKIHGYTRTRHEVHGKVRNLTAKYRKIRSELAMHRRSDSFNSTWRFYKSVHEILSSVPSNSIEIKSNNSLDEIEQPQVEDELPCIVYDSPSIQTDRSAISTSTQCDLDDENGTTTTDTSSEILTEQDLLKWEKKEHEIRLKILEQKLQHDKEEHEWKAEEHHTRMVKHEKAMNSLNQLLKQRRAID